MSKKIQSIDGFSLKRRVDTSSSGTAKRAFLDTNQATAKQPILKPAEEETALQKAENAKAEPPVSPEDVETSLQNLEIELDKPPESGQVSRRSRKLSRRRARNEKNKRRKVRQVIKRIFLTLLVLFLILAGWLAFKALMTGGKIFQGSVLDIFTSKTRLAEDADGRTNVLIFGTAPKGWEGEDLTDSIMVISFDQDNNDAYMISLPRDLYVKHSCKKYLGTTAGKLNETYICGYTDGGGNEESGASALRKTAGEITGLDIQYSAHVKWQAVIEAVDAVGGIDVVVKSPDSRGIYDVMTGLKLSNGPNHLDGEQALTYSRARNSHGGYGLPGGTFDRDRHQQEVLAALQQKALSAGTLTNPATVNALLDTLGDNLRTNFKTSEVQTLIDIAKHIKADSLTSLPLVERTDGGPDLVTTGMVGDSSIVRPAKAMYDYSDIKSYISSSISADPLVREAAVIDVLNGSGESGLAQEKADELKEIGFKIGKVTNAPSTITEQIKIYQLDEGKSATRAALEKKFNLKIISGQLSDYQTNADFIIVVGQELTN